MNWIEQAEVLVKETGDWICRERKSFSREMIEMKGKNDLVSYVDRTSEERLISGLSKILPGSGFIGEESGTSNRGRQNWIIDPLDGTTNYIHGVPVYCVSVALEEEGQITLGFVYDPERNEMFRAQKGQGATLNGTRIQVSSTPLLKDALIATGFPYTFFRHMDNYLLSFREILEKSRGIRRPGAAAIDLAWTACGRFDGFFESHLGPWDVAAGALLVQEAGGQVTTFGQAKDFVFGKEILTSNGLIHQELLEIVKKYPVT
jgi:myo-inositol-1(or 4)-monophosphatase